MRIVKTTQGPQDLQARIVELEAEVEKLRKLTERDDLTGCLRRDAFLTLLERRRSFGFLPKTTTLAVVDIDHFKRVNDTYGHAAGDQVLVQVSRALGDHAPEGSLICRMGGEEFVIVMMMKPEEAQAELEKLRRHLQGMNILTPEGQMIQITASFGAVAWNSDRPLREASITADLALYEAKKQGRNQVRMAS